MFRFPRSHRSRRNGGLLGGLLVCLIIAGVIGAIGYRFYSNASQINQEALITQVVTRGPFDHIVLEQGEIESSSNKEVICEVKSRAGSGTAILWVVDEGTQVTKGDKLVELDSADLELQLKEQRIQVITAEARLTSAEALFQQAEIAREEYLEGVFMTEEKAIMSEEAIADQNLSKAQLAMQSSERLVAKGLIKSLQLEADRYAVANAQNQLDAAKGRLDVLRELTKKKMLVQFDSDIEATAAALSAAGSELSEEQNELEEIEEQIKKCVMYAPSDGVVVHANRYSHRGGNAEFVVEAGSTVRERQAIIRLPDPTQMQVNCKINESQITLIERGMPVKISVDAIPGMKLTGRVKKVNRYAEPGGWFSSSIKEYATLIEIVDPPDNIRTGMTAAVQVFVEQLDDALQIPIQGLYEHGGEMYTLLQRGPGQFETAKVNVSATNDTMASISEGLNDDDTVVLNLRQHLTLMDLPEIIKEDNTEMRKIGAERAAAKSDELVSRDVNVDEIVSPEVGPETTGGPFRGGAGGGPASGSGRPDASTMVARSMDRSDTNGDGQLSADEIASIDDRFRSRVSEADVDGDGMVTRAELLNAFSMPLDEGRGVGSQ